MLSNPVGGPVLPFAFGYMHPALCLSVSGLLLPSLGLMSAGKIKESVIDSMVAYMEASCGRDTHGSNGIVSEASATPQAGFLLCNPALDMQRMHLDATLWACPLTQHTLHSQAGRPCRDGLSGAKHFLQQWHADSAEKRIAATIKEGLARGLATRGRRQDDNGCCVSVASINTSAETSSRSLPHRHGGGVGKTFGDIVPNVHLMDAQGFLRLVAAFTNTKKRHALSTSSSGSATSSLMLRKSSSLSAGGKACGVAHLSDDSLCHIFMYMSAKRVCRLACVCAAFSQASRAQQLWRGLYIRAFPSYKLQTNRTVRNQSEAGNDKTITCGILQCTRCSCLNENGSGNDSAALTPRSCEVVQESTSKKRKQGELVSKKSSTAVCRRRGKASNHLFCSGSLSAWHDWRGLYRERALATRRLLIATHGREAKAGGAAKGASSTYIPSLCPYVGCTMVLRSERLQQTHFCIHTHIQNDKRTSKGSKKHVEAASIQPDDSDRIAEVGAKKSKKKRKVIA